MTPGVASLVVLALGATALAVWGVYRALRTRGLRTLQRVERIAIACWFWLLLAVLPVVVSLQEDTATTVAALIVVGVGLALGVFMLAVAIYDRLQLRRDKRRDTELGIPHQPRQRTWEGALAIAILTFIVAGVVGVFIATPWLVMTTVGDALDAAAPSQTLQDLGRTMPAPNLGAVWTGIAIEAAATAVAAALLWKLPRDAALRAHVNLVEGIARRLNAEREIGRQEGLAARDGE